MHEDATYSLPKYPGIIISNSPISFHTDTHITQYSPNPPYLHDLHNAY